MDADAFQSDDGQYLSFHSAASVLPFFSSGGTSLLILLCEMGIILSISRAGNAQNAARSKRSHEELARRMNPQRRTHKALHSN